MSLSDIATSVRREEYTGENRCLPCTVVNVAIASVLTGIAFAAGYPGLSALVLAASLAAIYLRGYLVPGTPTLTKRYLPVSVLELFGKEPVPRRRELEGVDAADATESLFAAGVLTESAGSVRLGDEFRDAWREEIAAVRGDEPGPADVERTLGADDCDAQTAVSYVVDGNKLVRWESRAAVVADVAAARVLAPRVPAWEGLDRSERLDLLTGVRLFLDRCPACDEPLTVTERDVESCCQPAYTAVRSACEACEATVAEASVPADDETPTRLQFLAA